MIVTRPRFMMGILVLASLVLATCGDVAGESWPGITRDTDAEIVYVAYDKRVVALDAVNGETLWKYEEGDTQFFAVPTLDNGTMYIGDYEGRLHSVNLEDGTNNWMYEPDRETIIGPVSLRPEDRVISGVAVDGDKVYFGLGSRNVVAVSRETAEEAWTFETDHGVWGTPLYVPADPENETSQAVLYVVSLDHYLYAIDPANGDELWSLDLGGAAPGGMTYDPVLKRVYVGTFISELLAVDLVERHIVARFETEDWLWGKPALEIQEDGTEALYFGDLKGNLYALQITDDGFELLWSRDVSEDAIRATPLLVDDLVIVGSQDKHVYAVAKDSGEQRWEEETAGEALTDLIFVPADPDNEESTNLVILGTEEKDERVVAYAIDTGEQAWRYSD